MWNKPQLLMWLSNLLTALAVMLLFYALVFLGVNSPLFPIRSVEVEGEMAHVTKEQLQYVVKNELKGTFFTLSLDRTRQAFEKLPWVRKAEVRRYWPDRLQVTVEEHKAVARWGSAALLNTYGETFDAASSEALPVLEGPLGTEKLMVETYQRYKEVLAPLKKTPSHIWLSERRAWRLELDQSLTVEMGRDDGVARLSRFVTAYPNSLAQLDQTFEYVDLRYPNGFAVRLPGFDSAQNKAVRPAKNAAPIAPKKPA